MKQKQSRVLNSTRGRLGTELYLGFAPILILLIIVALGVVGYFGYKNSQKSITSSNSPLNSPNPYIPSNPTDNWKTYTNKNFNFSLEYPKSLIVTENKSDNNISTIFATDYAIDEAYYLGFSINAKEEKTNSSLSWLDSYMVQDLPNGTKGSTVQGLVQKYKNNNIVGYYFTGGRETINKNIIFQNKNYFYTVTLTGKDTGGDYKNNPNAEKTLDQILSTFKFLDSSPNPTCIPRPACLDATPRCMIPETSDMCPKQ